MNPNYTVTNRFSSYLRSQPGKDFSKIKEIEDDFASNYKKSKNLAAKASVQHRDTLAAKIKRKVPEAYQKYMNKSMGDDASPVIVNAPKERDNWANRSGMSKGKPIDSLAAANESMFSRDDRRVADKITSQLNEAAKNESHLYSRILDKKLRDKRIIVRDKRENQNKLFRDLLEEARIRHFSINQEELRRQEAAKNQDGDKKGYTYVEHRDIKKMNDKIKVELALVRLQEQLLDDFVYLANQERSTNPNNPANTSVLSKEYTKMAFYENSSDGKNKGKELANDDTRKLEEINEFMVEKTILNFKSVNRDPANIGLSYNLKLITKLPENYHNIPAIRWFEKGLATSHSHDLLVSINAFKQAVIQDGQLFPALYNLGCLYESVNDFELAFKWFYLAKTIDGENVDVNFALALCFYKLKRYTNAIELLENICLREKSHESKANEDNQESENSEDVNGSSAAVQTYILSICYKGMQNFEKAKEIYNKFIGMIEDSSNREVALYLFALLNKKNASFTVRKLEEVKTGLLRSFKTIFPQEFRSIRHHWDMIKGQWYANQMSQLVDYLMTLNFFKRFSKDILLDALKYFKFDVLKKDSIIFFNQKTHENVYVVLKGNLTVKDHSLNIEVPRTAINLQPGDIINPGDLDGGLFKSFHSWFRCNTDVEVIYMTRKSFENFWFLQTSFGLDTKSVIFKKMTLFKQVSEMTVFKIIYDLMEVQTFLEPTLIYDDLSYFDEYERRRANAFELKIKSQALNSAKDYLIRKSNALNRLYDSNDKVRRLIHQKSKAVQKGIYIILEGSCGVYSDVGKKLVDLPIGSTFGENLLVRVLKSYSTLGLIITGSQRTQLGFIDKSKFFRIPNYDIYNMYLTCQRIQHIEDINVDPF